MVLPSGTGSGVGTGASVGATVGAAVGAAAVGGGVARGGGVGVGARVGVRVGACACARLGLRNSAAARIPRVTAAIPKTTAMRRVMGAPQIEKANTDTTARPEEVNKPYRRR